MSFGSPCKASRGTSRGWKTQSLASILLASGVLVLASSHIASCEARPASITTTSSTSSQNQHVSHLTDISDTLNIRSLSEEDESPLIYQ
ncbi:hypothetical protein HK102_007821, partial [Quaeritorhiza haematococci]